jgi:hypothetical protein
MGMSEDVWFDLNVDHPLGTSTRWETSKIGNVLRLTTGEFVIATPLGSWTWLTSNYQSCIDIAPLIGALKERYETTKDYSGIRLLVERKMIKAQPQITNWIKKVVRKGNPDDYKAIKGFGVF